VKGIEPGSNACICTDSRSLIRYLDLHYLMEGAAWVRCLPVLAAILNMEVTDEVLTLTQI
jgi:hypothetical protein